MKTEAAMAKPQLRVPPVTTLSAICCLLLGAACSDDEPIPPVDLQLDGGFSGTILDGNRLVIRAADGRILLDGLPPGEVAPDGPPLIGFGVRDLTTSYEMQFGAFKPTDEAGGPWRGAERLRATSGAGGTAVEALDGQGQLLSRLSLTAPAEGHLAVALEAGPGGEGRLSWGFACDPDDHFAGFGAQSWDVDHRGQTVPAFVQENGVGKAEHDDYTGAWFFQGRRHSSHLPIPQYLGRRGYVLTAETDLRAIFALCSEAASAARIELSLPATVHLFDGPEPARALDRASAVFGRPRMPPRVAFAPWLDAIFGSDNVRRVAQKLRDEGIPSSVIWTEDWKGGHWTADDMYPLDEEWEVDETLYPDFAQLAAELHGLGFHWHVYFNPFIYQGTKAFSEAQPQGFLVQTESGDDYLFGSPAFEDAGLLDLDNPAARAWAVGKMQAAIALGADGWMNDFAEWLPTDAVTAAGPAYARHNTYPVEWQQVARQAIDSVDDGVARMFFGRSGWFGTPALADVIWAGDQRTDMQVDDGLPTIIPIGIGLGLVGVSTYGHDIAGYQSVNNPGSTKEVFFRWTELGAWSPVMRTHHGLYPQRNWSWEHDAETIAHFRRYARLHISLLPYLEGLARVAADTGLPIWRGLMVHYPEDASVWPITDQVLVGEGVMIAPVQQEGATSRDVYLPAGRWYPFGLPGGEARSGGQTVTVDAPLEEIPVFARAGAVIPTLPEGVMTVVNGSAEVPDHTSVGDDRVLYVFLGADGAFTEAGGSLLSYTLEHVADQGDGALSYRFDDQAVPACDGAIDPPCAADGEIHLSGSGNLAISAGGTLIARLLTAGGAADRRLHIVLRR